MSENLVFFLPSTSFDACSYDFSNAVPLTYHLMSSRYILVMVNIKRSLVCNMKTKFYALKRKSSKK